MAIGDFLLPGTTDKKNDAASAVQQTLAGDSPFWQSGSLELNTPGSQGRGYLQQAATMGATPITAHTGAMDADASRTAALSQLYAGLFQNGGLAEQAATQAGNADIASMGQGGAAGILQQILQSRQVMGRTSQVGTAERAQNAAGATGADFQTAAMNLAKHTMQMQATHATHMTALQAEAIRNYLQNQQIANDQNLYEAGSNAQGSASNLAQDASNADWKIGAGVATAALAGLGSAGATLGSMMTSKAAAPAAAPSTQDVALQQRVADIYATPPAPSIRSVQQPSPYYAGTWGNTYPSTPMAWALPSTAALQP